MRNKIVTIAICGLCLIISLGLINKHESNKIILGEIQYTSVAPKVNFMKLTSRVKVTLPFVKNTKENKMGLEINREIISLLLGEKYANLSPETAARNYCSDQLDLMIKREINQKYSGNRTKYNFTHKNTCNAQILDNRILTLENIKQEYSDTLSSSFRYINYDIRNNKYLTAKDVFSTEEIVNLKKEIIIGICNAYKQSTGNEMSTFNRIKLEQQLVLTDDFQLGDKAILFYYQLPNWLNGMSKEITITLSNHNINSLLNKEFQTIS